MKLQLALLAAAGAAACAFAIAPGSAVRPSAPAGGSSSHGATNQQAIAAYGKLPLAFTANAGQTDRRVRYSAQGGGLSVFLTRKRGDARSPASGQARQGTWARSRFASSARTGTSPSAVSGPAPGRVNYLLGNDPAEWQTGLRTYERVVYRNLWPGVDMVFHGQNGRLKYEFLVRPERPRPATSGSPTAVRGGSRSTAAGNLRIVADAGSAS